MGDLLNYGFVYPIAVERKYVFITPMLDNEDEAEEENVHIVLVEGQDMDFLILTEP